MAHIRSSFLSLVTLLACIGAVVVVVPASAQKPLVFAHYMLYADVDIGVFKNEIQLAQSKGIDAFALNFNVWRLSLVDKMYLAAMELESDFKLFFSADIHSDANGNLSPDILVTMLSTYSIHPNQMLYNNKCLITSWLGADDSWWAEFGTTAIEGWNNVFQRAGGKDKFYFIPFFPTDGSQWGVKGNLDQWGGTIDGLFAWDTSAWNPSPTQDGNYLSACNDAGKTFMASVSPWFFKTAPFDACQVKTDYQGPGLWLKKWKEVIDLKVPIVEIVTWNDWAESSYVGPQLTAQGAAVDVTSFPHQAYLELGAYYIDWYKSGSQPAITSNGLFMFYYTNSKNAGGACNNKDVLSDQLYVTTMLMQSGTLVLTSGTSVQNFSADAGINTYSIDFQPGQQSAMFNGQAPLVGEQIILSDGAIGAPNFNVYSTSLKF